MEEQIITKNFIEQIIDADLEAGMDAIATRFPPEPNGYLHIGHAKSIFLNFGLAKKYDGTCFLRFDDTNPIKEEDEYVESIQRDVAWLGAVWDGEVRFASDYFDAFYDMAESLIEKGLAYVDDQTAEEMHKHRGTLTEPGVESPYRDRSVEENLSLFRQMRDGAFADGEKVLRAKIDMASPNMNMRDPAIYRILHASHHRTGDKWCIYPMYDYAHPLEDAIEGITHSLCTLEFEDHRPLYNWFIDHLADSPHLKSKPQQIEFARLEIENTMTSKRRLKALVDAQLVDGWDDPRLPTISGLRRRGYTPAALKEFCQRIGVAKTNSIVEQNYLTFCLREDLNRVAPRAMAVLNPLKLTLTNYPEDQIEWVEGVVNPNDESMGTYQIPFGKHLYIEQEDFREEANRKYHRLKPGGEVRLMYGYIIKCEDYVKDPETGEITEVLCSYDPMTKSGMPDADRKVKGTLHWVEATHAVDAEVHLLDDLMDPDQAADADILDRFNKDSLEVLKGCKCEPRLAEAPIGQAYQFMRKGYYCADRKYHTPEAPVFNLTVGLRDKFKG
ncbi:glutamine--tRNA ligase/YqeY domain fusion protein [Peptococcus simiae]|uniref:Glutamine--tRNA ligase n=1 Tax=Peptococcus simiae TaxID=1643805 RepID=A0ABW9H0K5_9FIRM